MARTALSVQLIARAGLDPAFSAANVDGHSIQNSGRELLWVKNADVGAKVVTLIIPGTVDGQAIVDRTVSVPAGGERVIGPFPPTIYNQTGTSDVWVDFDAVTSVTVAAFRI